MRWWKQYVRILRRSRIALVVIALGCRGAGGLLTKHQSKPELASPVEQTSEVARSETAAFPLKSNSSDTQLVSHEEPDGLVEHTARQPGPPAEGVETDTIALKRAFGEGTVGLPELEQIALANHPSIRQSEASVNKARGFREQVGLRPNPSLGYNGSQLADKTTDQHTVYLSQDFVSGGKRGKNRNVMDQEIQGRMWEVEAQRRRVLTDVRQRYYQLLGAQRKQEMATDFLLIANKAVDIANRRWKAGEDAQTDLLQAEIQREQFVVTQRQTVVLRRGAWRQLAAAVGTPEQPLTEVGGELSTDPEPAEPEVDLPRILADSPEIHAAEFYVRRAQALWDRQTVQAIPNISVFVGGGWDRGTNHSLLNTQVGAPLPLYNQNQGNISAAYAEYCRAMQNLQRVRLSLRARYFQTAMDHDVATEAVRGLVKDILPRSAKNLKVTEKAREAGEIGSLQVLLVRRTYFDNSQSLIDAQVNLSNAQALIDGCLLSGAMDDPGDTTQDSSLRDHALQLQ